MTPEAPPPTTRDCTECGAKFTMRLLEIHATPLENVPLRYICSACGTMLTVPPRLHTR